MKKRKTPDPDKPLTSEEFRSMEWKHGLDALAEIMGEEAVAPLRARGRPPKKDKKVPLYLRVDPLVAERFRATGKGWQTRVNTALRELVESGRL